MHGLDQTSIKHEVCAYMTRKGALLDMNMKWNCVCYFCMMLGCTKVCLHPVNKGFKLRIGVKSEGTNSNSEAGISRKTGQHLR